MRLRSNRPLLAVLILAVAAGCASSGPKQKTLSPKQQVEFYRDNALGYYNLGELERAQDQVQRGLQVNKKDLTLNLILGWVLQRKGHADDIYAAERVFRSLLHHDDYRVYLGLAAALERKALLNSEASREIYSGDRYTEARDPEKQAAKLEEIAVKCWEESITHYEQTLELQPDDREAMNGMLRVTALLGFSEESLQWAERLLEELAISKKFARKQLEPIDITARTEEQYRGMLRDLTDLEIKTRLHASTVLRSLDRLQEATDHLTKIIEADPSLAEAYSRRAQLLYELGQYEACKWSVERFLNLSTADFQHPDIRAALTLESKCNMALAAQ
jgi:Tfp pilus assembly protein PilF